MGPTMGRRSIRMREITMLFAFWVFCSVCDAFYIRESNMHTYPTGSELSVKVNSLTSIVTELSFSYYSLPHCKPPKGPKKSAQNLGQLLMGDQIETSPYIFHMNKNESLYLCTSEPLREHEVKILKQSIDDMYKVNLILDNLPVMRYTKQSRITFKWTGFPVGFVSKSEQDKNHYIINHLKFKVLYHEYEDSGFNSLIGDGDEGMGIVPDQENAKKKSGFEVVGFEVFPCSVKRDSAAIANKKMYDPIPPVQCEQQMEQVIKEQEQITFTYEVSFVKSDIRWPSRWDAYLKTDDTTMHRFSILNSLVVIFTLSGIIFKILLRTVMRDLTKYEGLDKEAEAQMTEKIGWKLVVGDVFRAPCNSKLLCVMVGDGVQITGMAIVTTLFATLGLMSPASRGMLLTGMILLYLLLGIAAGYVAVRLWRTIQGDSRGWKSLAWFVACFFPGIVFLIHTILNFILWGNHSTAALPISLFFLLWSLWFCISVPLTLLGGFVGNQAEGIDYPVRTNQIPRDIPTRKYPSWFLVLGAGILPFGTFLIELFFIIYSIWMQRFYYVFGFLFVVLFFLVIVCAEVSLVLTYMHLCVEDWQWWWKSFFASGSVALYVLLYCIKYLIVDLCGLSGPVSVVVYVGYTLVMVFAVMLSTGSIGFLTSFYFVHHLFSSVAID